MENIFMQGSHRIFSWDKLGNISAGRENLGESMPVLVYRLMEYAVNDVLTKEYGANRADEIFRRAGYLAGSEFASNMLDCSLELGEFATQLQNVLINLQIGVLRIEHFDKKNGLFVLTVAEDLDCSGLPPTGEVVCTYDEGFLSGVMEQYTGIPCKVREVDCWANGARVCRFQGNFGEPG